MNTALLQTLISLQTVEEEPCTRLNFACLICTLYLISSFTSKIVCLDLEPEPLFRIKFLLIDPPDLSLLGNGPSGICLSYLLSGNIPYVRRSFVHPNPLLQRKLEETPDISIIDQVGREWTAFLKWGSR